MSISLQAKLKLSFRILAAPMHLICGKEASPMSSFCTYSTDSILIQKVDRIGAQNHEFFICFVLTSMPYG